MDGAVIIARGGGVGIAVPQNYLDETLQVNLRRARKTYIISSIAILLKKEATRRSKKEVDSLVSIQY